MSDEKQFTHIAKDLQEEKKLVFTAYSCRNFHKNMLISKFVFDSGAVPVNPFTNFGYYLYELVERDVVRNGNNNLLKRCDELWVFGEIADGVLAEIQMYKKLERPIRYFDISDMPRNVFEITAKDLVFEDNVKVYRNSI